MKKKAILLQYFFLFLLFNFFFIKISNKLKFIENCKSKKIKNFSLFLVFFCIFAKNRNMFISLFFCSYSYINVFFKYLSLLILNYFLLVFFFIHLTEQILNIIMNFYLFLFLFIQFLNFNFFEI